MDFDASFFPWPARAGRGASPYCWRASGAGHSSGRRRDPVNRSFQFNNLFGASLGVGVRTFAADRIAITLELRDLVYFEKIENDRVASGPVDGQATSLNSPVNPSTWYDANTHFTNAFQLRLGVGFFLFGG